MRIVTLLLSTAVSLKRLAASGFRELAGALLVS
jgi:hypothetical protein